jgi:hypothetical protein
MPDNKEPEKKKKNHFAKHWGKYVFGALIVVLAAEHISKQEAPNPLHESHAGHIRQNPDAPQRHHYDSSTRPEAMPSETHYIKGDLTEIFELPDSSSTVQFRLNQGDCLAVTGSANSDFYNVSIWDTQAVLTQALSKNLMCVDYDQTKAVALIKENNKNVRSKKITFIKRPSLTGRKFQK